MQKWNFERLELEGAYKITPFFAEDNRGGFLKDYSREVFENNGIHHDLAEVFYTISKKGVIRAMHFQRKKQQAKLVRCVSGKVFDVIIDLRKDSPTFMKWQGYCLTGENQVELLVPEGFGHGYLVLEDSVVSYKCGEKFYGEYDDGIRLTTRIWRSTGRMKKSAAKKMSFSRRKTKICLHGENSWIGTMIF